MSADPSQPGGNAPRCSQKAAESVPVRPAKLKPLTYTAICDAVDGGMTAHEISVSTGVDRHSIQPRITELRRKGLVIASGKRRHNPSGRTAIVWIVSEYADGLPLSVAPN